MPTSVALLRGINVGGKNLIRMPALKACFEENGFDDVVTYIQSGNVLFTAPTTQAAELTRRIEAMLAQDYPGDYDVWLAVRLRADRCGADPETDARHRRPRAEGVR